MEREYPNSFARAITREHRTAYILLLDLSTSMSEVIEHNGRKQYKSEVMAEAANNLLHEFYLRANSSGELRDYYDIAVLCYSGHGVFSLFGTLEKPFISIVEFEEMNGIYFRAITTLDRDESCEELSENFTLLNTYGSTPMNEAFCYLFNILEVWCSKEEVQESVAPMVIHITDGHATDSDLNSIVEVAEDIKSLHTNDGAVLLLNIHLGRLERESSLLFPTDEEVEQCHNPFLRAMGRASSIMPEIFVPMIHEMRSRNIGYRYRGVGCNATVADMIAMMNIGTLSAEVR